MAPKAFRVNNNEVVAIGNGKANKTVMNSFKYKNNKFEKLTYIPNIDVKEKLIFSTSNTKKAFNRLLQIFIKALIL